MFLEAALARKIRFRNERIYNLKILLVSILFLLIVSGGLLAVDVSKSYVLYGQTSLEMIKVEQVDKDIYQVSLLNDKFNINLKYLIRDINNLKNKFK